MNLMKKLVIGLFALFVFTGCSDISTVKNATLEFDKSITIGDAFDKYKYFKSTKWSDLETDNGKKVVQVDCEVDVENSISLMNTKLNKVYTQVTAIIQFTINKDGSFEITHISEECVDSKGQKSTKGFSQKGINIFLELLYKNHPKASGISMPF